jgi:hypothetical protein
MAYPARVPINHLKLLKDSAGKSVPGTRNSSLAQEKHGICEFLHMTAFNILISNFCNTENSVKWLTSQSFRKLTAYPKTLQESQPLLELRTVHLHSRRVNVTLLHMKTFHMLILSYSEQHMDYIAAQFQTLENQPLKTTPRCYKKDSCCN